MGKETFQVRLAGRTIEVVHEGGILHVDGHPVDASLVETVTGHFSLIVDGRSISLSVEPGANGVSLLRTASGPHQAEVIGNRERLLRAASTDSDRTTRSAPLKAPMPGLIVKILVEPGTRVRTGDPLVVLEAMKMENEIRATHDGVVERIHVKSGAAVVKNELLVEFAAE